MTQSTNGMRYSLEEILDLKAEAELSALCELAEIQSVYSLRGRLRGMKMADFLVDGMGRIDRGKIELLLSLLETRGYVLYPLGTSDGDLTEHAVKTLRALLDNRPFFTQIQRAGFPLCSPLAHELVSDSVGGIEKLNDGHLRKALLSALLTPLRQSVGSCFATAPAILIQEEQVERLGQDLVEILTTGQLKRTFGGIEYSVPMSPTLGSGDLKKPVDPARILFSPSLQAILGEFKAVGNAEEILKHYLEGDALRRAKARFIAFVDHPLLKIWEFTIASLSEVKMEFSRWNFYTSLGLHPDEKGGIGEVIIRYLNQRLQEENEQLELYHNESIIAHEQMKATERLLAQAGSQAEGRRLTAEHQSRLYQLRACLDKRDEHRENAEHLSGFFNFLLKQYDAEFPRHFQEIYDADMSDLAHVDYNDSPAGFRLVYKHGRSQAGSWSFIRNAKEYLQALSDFFLASEALIEPAIEWEQGVEELAHLTTAISHQLQNEEFLKSAFKRMNRVHGSGENKPWAYISGGTMPTLLKTYFRFEGGISEEARAIESPLDLCIFLIDLLKVRTVNQRLLMSSPSHAFSLLPNEPLFHQGCEDRGFTYTWIRDTVLGPIRDFYAGLLLSPSEQSFLAEKAGIQFSPLPGHVTPKEWRAEITDSPDIDAFLFSSLPLISPDEWKERAAAVLESIGEKSAMRFLKTPPSYLTRLEAHGLLIDACVRAQGTLRQRDLHRDLAKAMREARLAPPEPLIFADSNWAKYYFAFLVNPATEEFELWRLDKVGLKGRPMQEWRHYTNGISKETWGVYINPKEYC